MAPIMFNDTVSIKRSLSDAGLEESFLIKTRPTKVSRHHYLHWKQPSDESKEYLCQNVEAIQSTLTRAVGLALEAVGFEDATPLALESFRAHVEEYMAQFLAKVRQSMLSCRRTQAVPYDYLYSLRAHHLTLRCLIPHLDPPVSPSRSVVPIVHEPAKESDESRDLPLLGPLLNGASEPPSTPHVPQHFPPLPSKHTYKATPKFTNREEDPKTIRERATEEGRLGEEALRRLVGLGSATNSVETLPLRSRTKDIRRRRDELWRETMAAVTARTAIGAGDQDMAHDPGGTESGGTHSGGEVDKAFLTSIVNADRIYWRKDPSSRNSKSESGLTGMV